ncbi:MAG: cell envelope integrity protein CreD [Flavobacteriaceae bacterium]|jgi:inner membrane protein|nr:cell envelope integrity protein CreD [Flavobacteriaceae bacterium]
MDNQENQKQEQKPAQNAGLTGISEVNSKFYRKRKDNFFLKGLLVIGLILAMLIPTPFIISLINERQERQQEVVSEVGSKYGENQTLYGPFVKLPYQITESAKKTVTKILYISPNMLNISGDLNPFEKKRTLYKVLLYQANLHINVDFDENTFSKLDARYNYLWDKAELVFSIDDINGLEDNVIAKINGVSFPFEAKNTIDVGETQPDYDYSSSYRRMKLADRGRVEEFSIPLNLNTNKKLSVSFPLSIKGANTLNFLPISKKTQIKLNSNIEDLKFDGSNLPISSDSTDLPSSNRQIVWKIPSKNSSQIWDSTLLFGKNKFGVELIQPNDEYGKTNRVAKYSILFIGLTFLMFFFVEIINKLRIHPIQYVLVGLALSVFYLLLLSISEYVGFNVAYMISASATVLLITWFVRSIVKKSKIISLIFVVLICLYAYIFVIIQLDELALLAGSVGLFIILGLLMYFSRKIEWETE